MANSQKNYEGKIIHNANLGGAFRAGVCAEQPLDIATRCPYGLYSADFDDAYRVIAMEDARCRFVARRVDGYNDGYGRIEYSCHSADSLLPPTIALFFGRTVVDVEGGGYPFG